MKKDVSSPTSVLDVLDGNQEKIRIYAQEEKTTEEVQKYRILLEYKHLAQYPPNGVYVVPSFNNIHLFYGVIFVKSGLYQYAIFKFKITLPPYYNNVNTYPNVTFFAQVVHPYVDIVSGKLDLTPKFPTWDPRKHTLTSVVMFIKKMFLVTKFTETKEGNTHAWYLSTVDPVGFKSRVHECVDDSQRHVRDEPGSSIRFSPTDDEKYQVLRSLMKMAIEEKGENTFKEGEILKLVSDAETASRLNQQWSCLTFCPEWW